MMNSKEIYQNNMNNMNMNMNINMMNSNMMNSNEMYQNMMMNNMNMNMNTNMINPMMQMKQQKMLSQINIDRNENIVNKIDDNDEIDDEKIDYNSFDKGFKDLLNKIIKFYKNNDNENMDFDHPKQIKGILNLLNLNYKGIKKSNDIDDKLPYVKEEKKIIKFINSNFNLFNVKIPYSINKIELYSIAKLYKFLSISNILLIHNNEIIEEDDSSIDDISNGDTIIIIEDRNFPDNSYCDFLLKKYDYKNIINIKFCDKDIRLNLCFSSDTTVKELINAYVLKRGINHKSFNFLHDTKSLDINLQEKIGKIMLNFSSIQIMEKNYLYYNIGQRLIANIIIDGHKNIKEDVWTLNNTKTLFDPVQFFYSNINKNFKKIYIDKHVITREDETCLHSLGIKQDFNCKIE